MKLENVTFSFVAGIKTACLSRKELVDVVCQYINDYKNSRNTNAKLTPLVIFDSNGHAISLAHTNHSFYQALKQADLVHADGQSVVAFSRWFSNFHVPERSATTDTIHDIPQFASAELRHYFLGGEQVVVERCAEIMSHTYANFHIAGTQHGFFYELEEGGIVDHINQSKADVLWVGLGKPKEQLFVIRNKDKLTVPVIITCGGCYNYITGDYSRAPQIWQQWGIEWLHRCLTEPKKFFWRYLTTNPHSIYCAIKYRKLRY